MAALFFANGAATASWIPRIPSVRDRLDLDVTTLGLVLTGFAVGGLLGSVLSGPALGRVASRRVALVGGTGVAVGLPLVALAPQAWSLAVVLAAVGVFDALTDIAMNAQAVRLQRGLGRSVINRFHAGWSLGTLVGALGAAGAAAAGVGVGWHLLAIGIAQVAVLAWAAPRLLPPEPRAASTPARPDPAPPARRRLPIAVAAALAFTAFATAVVEGTPGEWSAVLLVDALDSGPGQAGLAFAAFTATMLTGRLVADGVVDRRGAAHVQRLAAAITAVGLVVTVTAPVTAVAIGGFAVLGLGVSALFPLLYLEAGTLPGLRAGSGLAVMSVGARLGFMAGPVLVGAVAGASDLRVGLGVVVGVGLVAMVVARATLHRTTTLP